MSRLVNEVADAMAEGAHAIRSNEGAEPTLKELAAIALDVIMRELEEPNEKVLEHLRSVWVEMFASESMNPGIEVILRAIARVLREGESGPLSMASAPKDG